MNNFHRGIWLGTGWKAPLAFLLTRLGALGRYLSHLRHFHGVGRFGTGRKVPLDVFRGRLGALGRYLSNFGELHRVGRLALGRIGPLVAVFRYLALDGAHGDEVERKIGARGLGLGRGQLAALRELHVLQLVLPPAPVEVEAERGRGLHHAEVGGGVDAGEAEVDEGEDGENVLDLGLGEEDVRVFSGLVADSQHGFLKTEKDRLMIIVLLIPWTTDTKIEFHFA